MIGCPECGAPDGVTWMGRDDFLGHVAHFRGSFAWSRKVNEQGRVFWWCHECHHGGLVFLDRQDCRP